MKSFKRLGFYLFSIVLVLIVFEFTLWIFGIGLQYDQFEHNKQLITDSKDKFKILTLGESTTAESYSQGKLNSWPRLLETKLNKSGINTAVFNEAIPSIHSYTSVEIAKKVIPIYKPDLIIAMIGINDSKVNRISSNDLKFRIRFLNLIFQISDFVNKYQLIIEMNSNNELKPNFLKDENDNKIFNKLYAQTKKLELKDIENVKDKKQLLNNLFWKYREKKDPDGIHYSYYSSKIGIQLFPKDSKTIKMYTYALIDKGECSTIKNELERILKNKIRIQPSSLNDFLNCFGDAKDRKFFNDLVWNYQINESKVNHSYDDLIRLAKKNQIKLILMQYPTLPMEELQRNVTVNNPNDIYFLSNEANFLKILKEKSYDDIFYDRFAGSWGHTTTFGNQIINNNLYNMIIKNKLHEK